MLTRTASILVVCFLAGCQTSAPTLTDRAFDIPVLREASGNSSRAALTSDESTSGVRTDPRNTADGDSPPDPESLALPVPVDDRSMIPEPATIDEQATMDEPATALSLDQLEGLALDRNPSLHEAHARLEAARGKWVQAGLPPNTLLGYSGQQLFSGGAAEQQGLYVEQQFVRGHKLRLNRAVVEQEVHKAEQLFAAQQQRVLTDVRLAYYDVLIAQHRNETTRELARIAEQAVSAAELLLKGEEVTLADVIRARVELQTAQLSLQTAKNQHVAAWSRLVAVTGLAAGPPQPLTGDIRETIQHAESDDLLAELIQQSPEMAAAMMEVERTRWAIERAVAEPIPNVDVQAILQQDNSTGGSNANLQVSLPIPWLNRNQGGIRQAQAEAIAAEHAMQRLKMGLMKRLATVYQRYATARNQVEAYNRDEGILANTKNTLDLVLKGYEAGEFSYVNLLAAQRTYAQAKLANVEAMGDLWAAYLEIDGLLLKDSLDAHASDGAAAK